MNETFGIIDYEWMQIDRNEDLKVHTTGKGNF
jgi:hypothetical protein